MSDGRYTPFAQAMDMMVDAMESYGRNRAWEDSLSSYAWQTQPWTSGAMSGMTGMSGMSPWGAMPGMGTGMPQTQMQQMFQQAPQAAQSMRGMAGQLGWPQQPFGTFGSPAGAYPGVTTMPGAALGSMAPLHPRGTPLDGAWQGNSGEILLVRDGQFRLYATRDTYKDGRIAVQGNRLVLADPRSGISREYEYAAHEDRLVLRDDNGNLLLYRRAPPESVRSLLH